MEDHQSPREQKLKHFGDQSRAGPEQPPGLTIEN
jgi:hypothetical protein